MGSENSQLPQLLSSKENCDFRNIRALWITKCASNSQQYLKKRGILLLTKRKARFDGCVRPRNRIGRKMRILKKLIPNCSEAMGVERVLRETAGDIAALQMRLKVMQVMVDALSAASDDDH